MENELNQEGAVVEQPKEDTSKAALETTPTEDKKTSEKTGTEERVYSAKEFQKMQSMKDTAEAEIQKRDKTLQSVQGELQQLRNYQEQQRLEERRKEIEALTDDPEGLAKAKHRHQLEDDIRRLSEQKEKDEGAVQRKYDQAEKLADQYSLSPKESRRLMKAGTPEHMEDLAQLIVAEREKVQVKTPLKESKESGFKPDTGISDVGGDDDATFLKSYSEGKSDDHKRARKILQKI